MYGSRRKCTFFRREIVPGNKGFPDHPWPGTSSRIRPHNAPFANRTIRFYWQVEIVSTGFRNSLIRRYFTKTLIFKGFLPCKIAGHKRPLFPDGVQVVWKKRGYFGLWRAFKRMSPFLRRKRRRTMIDGYTAPAGYHLIHKVSGESGKNMNGNHWIF